MTATFRAPLADFRVNNYAAATAQATITETAGTSTVAVSGTQFYQNVPVVMNVSATIAAGTGAVGPIQLNLIDGTSGGTPLRSWVLAAGVNGVNGVHEGNLNIPCKSGLATLEFSGTSIGGSQQAVNISGYIKSYSDS